MINPPRGNKRPRKEETQATGGQHSSKQIHAALSKMTNLYESFFAERGEYNETDDSPDSLSDDEV